MKARVYVAGSGVISSIGNSVSSTWDALRNSRSGIGPITLFDSFHRTSLPVGEVKQTNRELASALSLSEDLTRTELLGIHAAREAVDASGVVLNEWRTGLISATTVGGMDKTEQFFEDFLIDPAKGNLHDVVHHGCGRTAEVIAIDSGIRNFISTINTACSSSANAIALGTRMIQAGLLDVVVAGGSDALTRFTLNGFNSLMILDTAPCRPFDADRKGLNLGEGAGFVVLVSEKVKQQRHLNVLGIVSGFANTNDAFHQTASSPEGRGSYAAMQGAISMSGISPGEIDYINLHGTGTANNDLSEGTAVARLYGHTTPRMSSTKAYTGHTLGASGGIEAVISLLAIEHQCVFPNLRFQNAIPETGLVPQLHFEDNVRVQHVMSNSFGFGGNCSSLVFSKNQL